MGDSLPWPSVAFFFLKNILITPLSLTDILDVSDEFLKVSDVEMLKHLIEELLVSFLQGLH